MTDFQRFRVDYANGVYTVSHNTGESDPGLFYSRNPGGENRFLLGTMAEDSLSLPSPLPGERLYFFLELKDGTLLTAASRGVEIPGVENFRDMGGYPTAEGKTVRWGRFFRGGPIAGLGDGEKAALEQLGIKRIFDYRTELESRRVPDEYPETTAYFWVPALPPEKHFQEFADRDVLAHLRSINTPEAAEEAFGFFRSLYAAMPFGSAAFQSMLASLDSQDALPMYQHCSAGKDRTGVGSALLLLALGVPEAVVVEDYLLSRIFREEANRRRLQKMMNAGISQEAAETIRRMMNVSEDLIGAALGAIHTRYASYEDFFEHEYGISPERLAHWRELHTTR